MVALSTTEAEYMAAVEAGKEMLWMKDFIGELDIWQECKECRAEASMKKENAGLMESQHSPSSST